MPVLVPIGFILVLIGPLLHESIRVLGYAMVAFGLTAFVISNVLTEHDAKSKKEYEAKHSPRTMQKGMAVYKRYIGKSKFGAGDVLLDAYEIEFSYTVDTLDESNPITHKVKTYDLVHDKDAAVCMWLSQKDMTVDIEVFGSYDGLYYGDKETFMVQVPFTLINNTYGLKVTIPDEYVVRDKITGTNENGDNKLPIIIESSGNFDATNIRISLQRRKYGNDKENDDDVYNLEYEDIDLLKFFNEDYLLSSDSTIICTDNENHLYHYKCCDINLNFSCNHQYYFQ
jgi:hypothetical protein